MPAVAFAQALDSCEDIGPVTGVEFAVPASCQKPSFAREIPDGTSASEEELLAIQAEISEFIRGMDEYTACVNQGLRVSGDSTAVQYRDVRCAILEAAQAEVDEIAIRFVDQVVAFRAANDLREPSRLTQLPNPEDLPDLVP